MARPKGREPIVEVRRHRRRDGEVSEYAAVRYYDEHGVRRRKTCASVAEAEFERARLALVALSGRPAAADGDTLLGAFWHTYIADARGRLEPSTIADHEGHWRRQVEPRWAETAMRDIKPRAVSQWRASMLAAGVGPESVRKAMVLLQAMFTVAIEWGEATQNPVSVVRKPKQGRRRAIDVIDPVGVERLRAAMLAADDAMTATLSVVLAYTGMRPGEALALERRHIRKDTILVEQAVADGRVKVQKTGRAYRTIDLLPELLEDLEAWFARRDLARPDARLFPRFDGGWWTKQDYANWRKRHFHKHTQTVGLGHPRPYDLRHSFASLLIREQRTSIVELADQLGHSPTETLKTYSHVMQEYRRQEPVAASALIRQARERAREPAPSCGSGLAA